MEYLIIPAQPGYSLVYLDRTERFEALPPVSIIAWRVPVDGGEAIPVTVDELAETQHYLVIEPDGRVIAAGNGDFPSVDEALEWFNNPI